MVSKKYEFKRRRSKVLLEYKDNQPLTGYFCDDTILYPLIQYYESWAEYGGNFSYKDLMNACYRHIFNVWHNDYVFYAEDDQVKEEIRERDYLYTKDGRLYTGIIDN